MKGFTTIEIIIITVVLMALGLLGYQYIYEATHACIRSHFETQYIAPPSVVVGGSRYGGGVALPVGNLRPVNVEVCDERI